jgi:hypothetical protein
MEIIALSFLFFATWRLCERKEDGGKEDEEIFFFRIFLSSSTWFKYGTHVH